LQQIDAYRAEGLLVIPNFFKKVEIEQLKTCADKLQLTASTIAKKQTGKVMYLGTEFVLDKLEDKVQIHRIVWAGAAQPKLLELARQKKLLSPVSQLLESSEACHLINQLHYKLPHDEVSFDWHQDVKNRRTFDPNWQDLNKTGSFVQVIIAIDSMTSANGGIFYVPKSHLNGDLFLEQITDTAKLQAVAKLDNAIALQLNPGDVIFMDPYLIHGSKANISDKPRRIFINGFAYPGANKKPYPGTGSAQLISLKANND